MQKLPTSGCHESVACAFDFYNSPKTKGLSSATHRQDALKGHGQTSEEGFETSTLKTHVEGIKFGCSGADHRSAGGLQECETVATAAMTTAAV